MKSKHFQEAEKRVKKRKEFREHLQSFITVNAIMLAMGWIFGFFGAWKLVVFFWGIGLVFHYVDAYGIPGLENDEEWEKREMEKEMERLEGEEAVEENREEALDPEDVMDLDAPRPVKQKDYREEDLV